MKICKRESLHNNLLKGIFLVILSSMFTCTGQLFWKLSVVQQQLMLAFLGFIFYGFGAILLIYALHFGELSVLHPMLGIGYVLSIVLGSLFLGESLTINKLAGIVCIILGLFFISNSTEE